MTVYCDTSALVKAYVEEDHSEDVRAGLRAADAVATSAVTYPEMRATLARLHRDRRLTTAEFTRAKHQFDRQWPAILAIAVSDRVLEAAADLAEAHRLRALDSIHLASFQHLLERTDDDLELSTFDDRLAEAARRLRSPVVSTISKCRPGPAARASANDTRPSTRSSCVS